MDKEELAQKLTEDEKLIQKAASFYVRHQNLRRFASMMEVTEDDIEEIFVDYPQIEEKFNEKVFEESSKLARRKMRAGVPEAVNKLNELITDGEGDEKYAYQSASTLLNIWTRLDAKRENTSNDDEDELDKIWQEIEREDRAKESSKDMSRTQ